MPIVTRVASPLLIERERTYQLEKILAWLHNSNYCASEIRFVETAGNPIESVESAITRRNRPPAGLEDVLLFWDTVLRCQKEVGAPITELARLSLRLAAQHWLTQRPFSKSQESMLAAQRHGSGILRERKSHRSA